MSKPIHESSSYELIVELIEDGKAKVFSGLLELEPISKQEIVDELEKRHQVNFGEDARSWCSWFVKQTKIGTDKEREDVEFLLKYAIPFDELARRIKSSKDQ